MLLMGINGIVIEMGITFEETSYGFQTSDLTSTATTDATKDRLPDDATRLGCAYAACDLIPVLIWKEINLGATWKFVFRNAVEETDMLIGVSGNQICVPYLDRDEFTAQTATEAYLKQTGYQKYALSPKSVCISIGDVVYVATYITDILREDSKLEWVRASLQKMGQAIAKKIDEDIRDCLRCACTVVNGNVNAAATPHTLAYDDVVDAVQHLKSMGYWGVDDGPMLLFVHVDQEGDLVKDTRFTDTARYSTSNIPLGAGTGAFNAPERGRYASCRAFVTDLPMVDTNPDGTTTAYALVVAPPTNKYGPAAMLAWKRHIRQRTERQEQYEKDMFVLSTRYGVTVKFADAIKLISDC